jgi:hypothetical protein
MQNLVDPQSAPERQRREHDIVFPHVHLLELVGWKKKIKKDKKGFKRACIYSIARYRLPACPSAGTPWLKKKGKKKDKKGFKKACIYSIARCRLLACPSAGTRWLKKKNGFKRQWYRFIHINLCRPWRKKNGLRDKKKYGFDIRHINLCRPWRNRNAIKALFRRYSGAIQALLRRYKALLRIC